MKAIVATTLLIVSSLTFSESFDIRGNENHYQFNGAAFDTFKIEPIYSLCHTRNSPAESRSILTSIKYSHELNSENMSQIKHSNSYIAANLSIGYGLLNASGNVEQLIQRNQEASSFIASYDINYTSHVDRFNPPTVAYGPNCAPDSLVNFLTMHGDSYISEVVYGLNISFGLSISYSNKSYIETTSAKLAVKALFGLIKATKSIETMLEEIDQSAIARVYLKTTSADIPTLLGVANHEILECDINQIARCVSYFNKLVANIHSVSFASAITNRNVQTPIEIKTTRYPIDFIPYHIRTDYYAFVSGNSMKQVVQHALWEINQAYPYLPSQTQTSVRLEITQALKFCQEVFGIDDLACVRKFDEIEEKYL